MLQDDASLIRRAQQGDQAAFEKIYVQCQPSIYTYVFYRVGDEALAEDLTAEVFVRLVDKVDTFTEQGRPILAWLYVIARNLIADHYRRAGRDAALPLEETIIAGDYGNPAQVTERRLMQTDLVAALHHLTEEQRHVIILKFVEGRSNADIGAILGKSEGAIKSLQHRALAALRRVLEKERAYGP